MGHASTPEPANLKCYYNKIFVDPCTGTNKCWADCGAESGSEADGGEQLVDNHCDYWISQDGYCGQGQAYEKEGYSAERGVRIAALEIPRTGEYRENPVNRLVLIAPWTVIVELVMTIPTRASCAGNHNLRKVSAHPKNASRKNAGGRSRFCAQRVQQKMDVDQNTVGPVHHHVRSIAIPDCVGVVEICLSVLVVNSVHQREKVDP